MLIDVLKFTHLLLTLGLLGLTFFCLILAGFSAHPERNFLLIRFSRLILWFLVLAMVTGTLLVYPKHFTFHTPWIRAAYFLVFLSGLIVSMLIYFRKKNHSRVFWFLGYFFLMMILVGIVHDAVTKMALFYPLIAK
ncbi:MAG TPA: hypothetical protein VLJ15_00015 [Gammaproteobacteria bacterium]|nr:hypothetical protein [Gammaproteobacteria bacterium]